MKPTNLPDPRAVGTLAKTIHRQLRQANYSRSDMLKLVNALLEAGDDDEAMESVRDPGTNLPNAATALEALAFVLRRCELSLQPLLLFYLDVKPPPLADDEAVDSLHRMVGRALAELLRSGDVVGRVDDHGYILAFPGATAKSSGSIATRLVTPIVQRRDEKGLLLSTSEITLRYIVVEGVRTKEGGPRTNDPAAWVELSRQGDVIPIVIETATPAQAGPSPSPMIPRFPTSVKLASKLPLQIDTGEQDPVTLVDFKRPHALISLVPPAPRNLQSSIPPAKTIRDGVVLALGGGAARAGAHIGVLRAFERAQIPVVGIAGTSAGAIIGAMYLRGISPAAILERFLNFPSSSLYSEFRAAYASFIREARGVRTVTKYFRSTGLAFFSDERLAALTTDQLSAFVEYFVGKDADLSSLSGRFATVATDVKEGRSVPLQFGPLHLALRATCALPGLFPPQLDGGRILVDGSVVTEVPLALASRLSEGHAVVGIYIARPDSAVEKFATSAELVIRSNALVHAELVREQLRSAKHLVTVPVAEYGWLDFHKVGLTADVGEKATEAWLRENVGSSPPSK